MDIESQLRVFFTVLSKNYLNRNHHIEVSEMCFENHYLKSTNFSLFGALCRLKY